MFKVGGVAMLGARDSMSTVVRNALSNALENCCLYIRLVHASRSRTEQAAVGPRLTVGLQPFCQMDGHMGRFDSYISYNRMMCLFSRLKQSGDMEV
jgi:hypothetical protein